jgi:choline dehydrogenase-like flavoprotein
VTTSQASGATSNEAADVLIIGAGASGGVAALRLATAGLSVVCLEQGDWPDRASFRGSSPDWELNARKQWSAVPSVRRAPGDYAIDCKESDISVANFNGVGGGTVLYNAQWPRMIPADFHVRSSEGIADDWPLTYGELSPYYDRVDRQFGVSGLGGNPIYPPGADPPLPPLPIGESGSRVARAHARLGWHWWPETNAILSAPYEGRHPCVQRGTCTQGCNEGAKSSSDLTHWPAAVANGCRLITGATATRILLDQAGRACGANWLDRNGTEHRSLARVVLCAANGIGTPRLLLSSACNRFPDGLANSSGLVGKRLMMHPLVSVTGYFEDSLASWQGQAGALIQSLEFYRSHEERGFVRGARWALGPTGGPLGLALAGRVWGDGHHQYMQRRFGRGARWGILCEDLPEDSNRVVLSDEMDPHSGMAIPKVIYRVSDNSQLMQAWHQVRATESLAEAGAVFTEAESFPFSGHAMGTARMGNDRASSVVNRWGFAHDVPNLGVIDGSVFVTAGGMNPTSTICALALRTADYLVAHRNELGVAETSMSVAIEGKGPSADQPAGTAPIPGRVGRDGPSAVVGADPDQRSRERLARLANLLIPGSEASPSADQVGVSGVLLDQVLRARPDLAGALQRALADPFDDAARRLEELRADDGSAYRAVITVVAGGYYLDPRAQRALGYAGQQAIQLTARQVPAYVLDGLLDEVRDPT